MYPARRAKGSVTAAFSAVARAIGACEHWRQGIGIFAVIAQELRGRTSVLVLLMFLLCFVGAKNVET